MWDTKRQIIWLAGGITLGTLVLYGDAHDESGQFDLNYFVFLEMLLLTIIAVMFYLYTHKK